MSGGDASADASRRAGSARDSASSSRPPKPFWRWHPSRGRPDERDDDPRWLARRKHFFILSDAGKPVWSRYGDAANLSSFAAAVSAMLASASEQLNSGSKRDADDQGLAGHDEERVVSFILDESFHNSENKPPNHARVVALTKNGLSFVALSRANESKNVLLRQTRLFRHQLLFVLTSAVERAVLRSGSKFDPHRLLRDETGGAARALGALAHQCTWDPGAFLGAWAPLPFSSNKRRKTYAALREALGDVKHMRTHGTSRKSGIFFAMVATARHVVALAASPRDNWGESKNRTRFRDFGASKDSSRGAHRHARDRLPMHPDDVYVLTHFARHVGASRHNDETFAPVCLPRRDPTSFAHAHVTVLSSNRRLAKNETARDDDDDETSETSDAGTFLVLVAEEGGPDAFSAARRCKADIEKTLRLSSSVSGGTGGCVLDAIERRVSRADDDVEKTEPASPSNPSPKIGEEGVAAVLSAGRPLQTVSRLTREEPLIEPRRRTDDENAHVGEEKEHADDRRDDNKPSLGAPPWRIVTAPEDKKNPRPGDVARGSVRLDREVPRAAGGGDSTRRVLHFLYVRPTLGQYVAPEWSAPLDGRDAQKATLRAYRRVADAVSSSRLADDDVSDTSAPFSSTRHGDRGGGGGGGGHAPFSLASFFQGLGIGNEFRNTTHGSSHSDAVASTASRSYGDYRNGFDHATGKDLRRVHFESSGARVLLGFAGSDFELYVAMAPGTSRTDAVAACNRLCTWLRQEEPRLFAAAA